MHYIQRDWSCIVHHFVLISLWLDVGRLLTQTDRKEETSASYSVRLARKRKHLQIHIQSDMLSFLTFVTYL